MEENNTMEFVFWQNMLSIHQSALIKALARDHDVLLAVQTDFEGERRASGWTVPDMGNARILLSPTPREAEETVRAHPAAIHVFSGINTYPMVYAAFKQAVRSGLKIMVYAEPYRRQGWRGALRTFKYRLLQARYGKKITALLATGRLGVECYRRAGFPENSIFEWGYFTESAEPADASAAPAPGPGEKPDLLFVGQLVPRKNVLPFLRAARQCSGAFRRCHVVGDGPLREQAALEAEGCAQISLLGTQGNEETRGLMRRCDLLVLPSLFDGWGAVVNEALQAGMRVLCSTACGAASLLDGHDRGGTFDPAQPDSLPRALQEWLGKGPLTPAERNAISAWAEQHAGGTAAAHYLEQIAAWTEGRERNRPTAPWAQLKETES